MSKDEVLKINLDDVAKAGGIKMATIALALEDVKSDMEKSMRECDKKKSISEEFLKGVVTTEGLYLCLREELKSKEPLESKVLTAFSKMIEVESDRFLRFAGKVLGEVNGEFMVVEGGKEPNPSAR